jgi:hypothetical protein
MNFPAKRERFVQRPLSFRLGSIAADLARVSSTAKHDPITPMVDTMMAESLYFIEWTAAETEPEVAAELVDIQRMLGLWRKAWPEAQKHRAQRLLLSVQAKKWSDQVLGYSGLLDE